MEHINCVISLYKADSQLEPKTRLGKLDANAEQSRLQIALSKKILLQRQRYAQPISYT